MLAWLRRLLGLAPAITAEIPGRPSRSTAPQAGRAAFSGNAGRPAAGFIDGRHFVDWTEDARHLEWMGDLDAAQLVLMRIVLGTEAQSAATGQGVAPFAYERLAVIARRRRDRAAEIAILERFAEQTHATGASPAHLLDRLAKIRAAAEPAASEPRRAPPTTPAPPFWLAHMPAKILFVDVETTGLRARDRIVSIGAIELTAAGLPEDRVDFRFVHLVCDSGRKSHPDAEDLHGYSDWLLRQQQPFAEIAPAVAEMIGDCDLVAAHNAAFDVGFIDVELAAAGLPAVAKPSFCTIERYLSFYSGPATLDAVAARAGLSRAGPRHGALEDAWLAMMVYLWRLGCPCRIPFAAFPDPQPGNLRAAPPEPFGEPPPRKRVPRLKAPRPTGERENWRNPERD